jgi:hypothetical protein
VKAVVDEPQKIDEDEDLDEVEIDDPEEAEAELALATEEDDEGDDASLDELLAQRAVSRRSGEDVDDDDDDDIMSLTSQKEPRLSELIPARVIPVKDQKEFVCKRCHLVKARSQLKDVDRMLCRDCA